MQTTSLKLVFATYGTFADRGAGADALSVQAGLLANLISGDVRVQPFIAAGGGFYRASFDLTAQRFFGGMTAPFDPDVTPCGRNRRLTAGGRRLSPTPRFTWAAVSGST